MKFGIPICLLISLFAGAILISSYISDRRKIKVEVVFEKGLTIPIAFIKTNDTIFSGRLKKDHKERHIAGFPDTGQYYMQFVNLFRQSVTDTFRIADIKGQRILVRGMTMRYELFADSVCSDHMLPGDSLQYVRETYTCFSHYKDSILFRRNANSYIATYHDSVKTLTTGEYELLRHFEMELMSFPLGSSTTRHDYIVEFRGLSLLVGTYQGTDWQGLDGLLKNLGFK